MSGVRRVVGMAAALAWLASSIMPTAQAASAADVRAVARGANTFGCDLYAQLRTTPGNLCLSPYGLSTSLTMLRLGAAGTTADELRDTLHHPEVSELHAITGGLATAFGSAKAYDLGLVTALWLPENTDVNPTFAAAVQKTYHATVGKVDFAHEADARKAINTAAEKATKDRVAHLVPPAILTPKTQGLLTSAAYFRGAWTSPFQKAWTQTEEFAVTPEKRVKVPMMRQLGVLPYAETDKLQALELPFAGGRMAMLVLLPRAGVPLEDIEKKLTSEPLADLGDALTRQKCMLRLPRFHTGESLALAPALKKLGLATAFTDAADFSPIAKNAHLTDVIHQAYVEVNEEGADMSEAAAPADTPTLGRGDHPVEFTADHPFVFLIWERASHTIFFLGRVADPTH